MKKVLFFVFFLLGSVGLMGQEGSVVNVLKKKPVEAFENIKIEKLYSDERATSFLIWVKKGVEEHYHSLHTEQLYVLSGKGKMTIKGEVIVIKKGDFIVIPKGTNHSVKVVGRKPLKVLSIQAPEFKGKDRIFTAPN